jgi:hypothetical protein
MLCYPPDAHDGIMLVRENRERERESASITFCFAFLRSPSGKVEVRKWGKAFFFLPSFLPYHYLYCREVTAGGTG